jgi:prepilin-type N-terminal cleavage/methylation domain-containing protein
MKTSKTISHSAFTMLELVFVIVVVGILSYFVSAGFQRNTIVEAADQIVSHIRYTQHLAMMDDKFDSSVNQYYRERWQIRFTTDSSANGHLVYWIMSDKNHNNAIADLTDYAKDPQISTTLLSGDSSIANRNQNLDLTKKYGIITVTNNCAPGAGKGRIFFDEMGRPYNDTVFPATTPHQNLITGAPCTIVIADGTQTRTIELSPETGYVRHY